MLCTLILLLFSKEEEDERKYGNNKDDNTIDIHILLSCTIAVFCPCYQLIIATGILASKGGLGSGRSGLGAIFYPTQQSRVCKG